MFGKIDTTEIIFSPALQERREVGENLRSKYCLRRSRSLSNNVTLRTTFLSGRWWLESPVTAVLSMWAELTMRAASTLARSTPTTTAATSPTVGRSSVGRSTM